MANPPSSGVFRPVTQASTGLKTKARTYLLVVVKKALWRNRPEIALLTRVFTLSDSDIYPISGVNH